MYVWLEIFIDYFNQTVEINHDTFLEPPNSKQARAFLTSTWPYIDGAINEHNLAYASGLCANSLNSSSWSMEKLVFNHHM